MGRQKGHYLNAAAKQLVEKRPDLFSTDFNENKTAVTKLGILKDALQERNKLAGVITKIVRQQREEEAKEAEGRENRAPTSATQAPLAA